MTFSTFASPGVSLQGGGGSGGGAASLPISGNGATVTASTPLVDGTQTWNNAAVTFTSFKLNITDTASNAASLLMDLQVGGASRFTVNKLGLFQAASSVALNTGYHTVIWNLAQFGWGSSGTVTTSTSLDTILTRRGAANLRLGAADTTGTTAPTPQFLSAQSWLSSTTNNQTGANFTIDGSQGTGTGAGGSIIFRVAPAGGTSNGVQNALVDALTITSNRNATFANTLVTPKAFPNGYAFSDGTTIYSPTGVNGITCYGGTLGANFFAANGDGARVTGLLSFSGTNTEVSSPDLILARDAANTLALRNGANAQAFRVYNTYTSDSVYERAEAFWSGNMFTLRTAQAGGGSARSMTISTQGDANLLFSTNSVTRADFSSLGIKFYQHILLPTDNTYDIGAASADRPRSVYAGTSITPGAGVVVASLPTPSTGMIARVTDATAPVIGATVAGGGAAYALVNYNGANWTVIGV